jgi:endonuclease YncB( thermonuclease family)
MALGVWFAREAPRGKRGRPPKHAGSVTRTTSAASAHERVCTEVSGKVVTVHDGDTITVVLDEPLTNGVRQLKIRLLGIDAPEMSQPHGVASRGALDKRVHRRAVRVVFSETDTYGRALADVYASDHWINRELVASGKAWDYSYPTDARLAEAQKAAAAARRGLWREQDPVPPRQWRKQNPRE